MRRSERDGVEIKIQITQTLVLLEHYGIQRGGYMDDRALPPLSGLCLHELSDEEYAPDATSGAANERPREFSTKDYDMDKKSWQSTDLMDGQKTYELNQDFYSKWIPIARQDTFCYTKNVEVPGVGIETNVMMPTQYILRVVSDALGFASPEDFAQREAENIYIVDGSNMLDLDRRSNGFETFNAWNHITTHLNVPQNQNDKVNKTVICIMKTTNLDSWFFPDVAMKGDFLRYVYNGDVLKTSPKNRRGNTQGTLELQIPVDGVVDPDAADYGGYKRLETMLCRLTNKPEKVFVVAIDEWDKFKQIPATLKKSSTCMFHEDDPARPEHGFCEYDDVLTLALREHILQIARGEGDLTQPREPWYSRQWGGPPIFTDAWPRVVTLDSSMKNLSEKDSMCRLLAKFFEHRNVLGFHLYQSMQGFATNCMRIIDKYPSRYTHNSDYVRSGDLTSFPFRGSIWREWLCGPDGPEKFLEVVDTSDKKLEQLSTADQGRILNLKVFPPPGWYAPDTQMMDPQTVRKREFLSDLPDNRSDTKKKKIRKCWSEYEERIGQATRT